MAKYLPLPDGNSVTIRDGETPSDAWKRAIQMYPESFAEKTPEETPKSGFVPALKAGFSSLKGDVAALAGRTGLMGLPEAESYIAEQEAYRKKTFAPTQEGFFEAPLANISELAGGSLPYMAAPLAAGAATLALPATLAAAPVLGGLTTAGTALGLGAAGLTSAAQFTGSGLTRQMTPGEGMANKSLGETDLTDAALAAIPSAVLDTISLKMIPGLGKIFERAGIELTTQAAKDLAKEGIKKTAADYLLATGKTMGVEGLTEAGQQVFERMQAGLAIDNPTARAEYFDSFIGGAVLGGILAPAGRYVERGQEQTRFDVGARAEAAQTAQQNAIQQAELAAQAAAEEETYKQSQPYMDLVEQQYADLQSNFVNLKAQAAVKVDPTDLAGMARLVEAKKALKAFMSDEGTRNTIQEYNRIQKLKPQVETEETGQETPPVAPPVAPAEQPAAIPLADTIALLDAHIEAVSTQAQGAAPAQIVEFGAKQKELQNLRTKINRVTGAMNKANELGNTVLAAKHAATLLNLQIQVGALGTPATAEVAPETTVVAPPTVTPPAPAPAAAPTEPTPLKPYTGITEQGLMFPETGAAESVINAGQGKQPEQSRQELVAQFQAAKQVRDRLGMQNAIEQMRTLAERSKARSEGARGAGVPTGEVTTSELAQAILGQKLTATGSQPPSREMTNAAKVRTTPDILRKQIANLPDRLSPESERLVSRLLGNFDEFTADPERLQLAAGFLHDLRTGVSTAAGVSTLTPTARARDVASELNALETAKTAQAPTLFGEGELPVIEGPRKPLPVLGYSEPALPPKPLPYQRDIPESEKVTAELAAERATLDKEREDALQKAATEADKRVRAALQETNNAAVRYNALEKELADGITPIYASYVDAQRNPGPDKALAEKRKLNTALAYTTAKENNRVTLAEAKQALDDTKASLEKVRDENTQAIAAATTAIDTAQQKARETLLNKGKGAEAARDKAKVAAPAPAPAPEKTTSLVDRENADAAKRNAENERAERLAAIPGESISHQAYRDASNTVKDIEPRLAELSEKAANETLPEPTRNKAKREILKHSRAKAFLAGSNEGLGEMRLQAEERLAKVRQDIGKKAAAVAENPTKSRKQELAKFKREEKKLDALVKGYKSRSERTPIVTPTAKTRQAAENRAARYLELQGVQETKEAGSITPEMGALREIMYDPASSAAEAAEAEKKYDTLATQRIAAANKLAAEMEALQETINNPQASKAAVAEAQRNYKLLETQRLGLPKVGPVVRKAQAAGNVLTGDAATEAERTIDPGLKPTEGGAVKSPTTAQVVKDANKIANEKIANRTPLTTVELRDISVAQEKALLEAAADMVARLERQQQELIATMARAANSANPSQKSIELRAERALELQGIERDLSVAYENETKLAKLADVAATAFEEVKVKAPRVKKAKEKKVRSQVVDESDDLEAFSPARGVEVESPDLSATQQKHIADDNIRAALRDISDDTGTSSVNRAVARKLSLLLDFTHVAAVDNLTDKGEPVLGRAISTEVELDAKDGMTQEVLLHEGTHAAVDRVLAMPEDRLTPTQLAAKRELKALFEAAKRDPSITSMNAKSSLQEFAAEVLSNRNLQEQLRSKKWSVSDAFRGIVSTILRLIGFTKAETDTMLGAGIKAVEALMVPSSVRGLVSERALNAISAQGTGVPRSNAQKDIAALHDGSNSMRQFAEQFGTDIKTKDRTPADAERIGQAHLDEISRAVDKAEGARIRRNDPDAAEQLEKRANEISKYIALPTLDSLDYRVRMPDGKPYDENNPLHYLESTVADHMNMKAQNDPKLRLLEAGELSKKRLKDYSNLLFDLRMSDDFTTVERALIAKIAGKFSVISDDKGRLKLVEIGADNRHNVAVVSAADAAFVVQKLREGLPLKKAFLEGLQENADRNVKQNLLSHKTGWQKFERSDTEKAAQELSAGAAGTPWCTAREAHSRGQIARGDFYIYYDNGRPEVAVRMEGSKIAEVRGNSPSQSINIKQQQLAEDFLRAKKFEGHEEYLQEFAKKNAMLILAKDPESINPVQMMQFDLATVADRDVKFSLDFPNLDGHESGIRPAPTTDVIEFFKERLIAAGEKAMEAGYYPANVRISYDNTVKVKFNNTDRDVDTAKVIAVNYLTASSATDPIKKDEFPELVSVNRYSVDVDATFTKLNSIGRMSVRKNTTLTLPADANISLVQAQTDKPVTATIRGATVIKGVLASTGYSQNAAFTVKALDARYIPNEQTYDPYYPTTLSTIEDEAYLVAKYGDADSVIEALADRLPDSIRGAFNASTSNMSARYVLADAIMSQANTLADYAKVNKIINAFWTPGRFDTLPEAFGTIDAPNRIAENPPFGEITEEPEVPSYARAAKYGANDALSDLAQSAVAQPQTLREEAGSNIALRFEMAAANMRAGVIKALDNAAADPNTMGSTKLFRQAVFSITAADQSMSVTQMSLNTGPPTMFKDAKGYYEVRSSNKNDAGAVFDAVQDIPDTYGNTEAKMGLASAYMIAQRAMNKGLKKLDLGALGVTEAKLAAAMAAVNADPALKTALESVRAKYNAYNRGMIEWLSSPQVAAITQADAAAYLKDEDYVPYYRVRADGVAELVFGGEKTITIGDIRHQPYLAELKGGESKIMPLDQSIMRNTMLLVTKGMSNIAMKNVGYAMQAAGQGLGPVDKTGKPTSLMPIHTGKGPANADNSVIRWTQEPDPRKPSDNGDRWLRVQTNDTIFGGIPAELIIKSLDGAHLTLPAFLKWGGIAGDLLRSGVTRTPIYLARQLFRDPFAATATSGLDYNPITAIFKANKEFLKIVAGKSEVGAKMIEKGLMQAGMFEGDPANMSKIALQLASGKSQGILNKLFAGADRLALQADAATRALIYENAIKNGLSEVEASHSVRESMNFSKRGLSPTVQYFSRMIPFFNAQIQGLSVLFKAATGNMPANDVLKIKRKFYNNAMMLTGFGIAYAMAMDDDEYYKNAKPRDRYTNFFVPLPGVDEPLKLPIPYEFGFFFSAGVALADAIKGEVDTPQQLRALKDMFVGAIPGTSSNFMPQIIKPMTEIYANKIFFSGNAIESERQRKLDPEARYNAHTTEVAKWMATMVPGLSPIQIEHIVSGYLGQIPLMVLASTNDLFRDGKEEPTRKLSERPLIGSAFQRKYGGEEADVVYKLATEASQAKRTFDDYRKTGKIQEAKDYLQEHRAELAVAPMAMQYQKIMGALRTQEEIIRNSKASSDAKEKRIDELNAQRQLQSERYLKAIRRAQDASGKTTPP